MSVETVVYLLTHTLSYLAGAITVVLYALYLSNRNRKERDYYGSSR
jgi:hypothetical protein